jgi:parallel beta-helix repeat protein
MDLASSCDGPFTFTNCYFKNNRFVNSNSADFSDVVFTHCTFESNYQGVKWNDGGYDVYVNGCTFLNNTIGATAVYVTNSVFSGNTQYAVNAKLTVQNCEIYNNNLGILCDMAADTKVANNYVHDNTIGVEMQRFWNDSRITFQDNKICHNTTWNIQYDFAQNGNISGNCFCSTDSSYIRSTLRDGYVNASYGLLSYNIDNSCMAGVTEVKSVPAVSGSEVKLYPNPFSDHSTLSFPYEPGHAYELNVVDQLGRVAQTIEHITSGKVTIPRATMVPGLYYYQLKDEQGVIASGKLSVE